MGRGFEYCRAAYLCFLFFFWRAVRNADRCCDIGGGIFMLEVLYNFVNYKRDVNRVKDIVIARTDIVISKNKRMN